jgi:transcriptional/translational regulatory protein YebC/TACO1
LQLRQERNQKLSQTDWRALSDQTLSQEWSDYRQALRDLTQDLETIEDVNSVVWPSEPSE